MLTVIIALALIFLIAVALISEHRSRRLKSNRDLVDNQSQSKPELEDEEEDMSVTSTARMRARNILNSTNTQPSSSVSKTSPRVFKAEPVFPEDLPPLPDPFEKNHK